MRKFLLTAAALLLGVSGMTAAKSDMLAETAAVSAKWEKPAMRKVAKADAASRWDCSYILGEYIAAGNFQTPGTYMVAVVIPEHIAKQCVGSKLTDIFFFMGTSVDKNGRVFITKGLGGEKLWEKDVTLNLGSVSGNNFKPGENEIVLEEPYVFTGDEIAVGYEFVAPRSTNFKSYSPLCYGNETPVNSYCDNVGVTNGDKEEWAHLGIPLSIMVGVEGENLPTWVEAIGYDLPFVVKPGEKFDVNVTAVNLGASTITSANGFTSVDGIDGQEQTASLNIRPGSDGDIIFSLSGVDKEGVYSIGATVNKVNGLEIPTIAAEDYVKSVENGVKRRVVIEEWTGTWCGYCPRGIWGMEYLEENYPDDFVGIAIHSSNGSATDPMNLSSYINSLAELGYVSGFPGALIDRMVPVSPSPVSFAAAVELLGGDRGFGDIAIEAKYVDAAEKKLEIHGKAKIVYDVKEVNETLAKSQYRIAFVITENKVPGQQTNYFYNGQGGECGGWESLPYTVNWKFNDVARKIDTFEGIKGLLPAEMEKDKEYEFTHSMTLPSNVKVGSNIDIIALLINDTTGFIENAVKIAGPQRAASIDNVAADGNGISVAGGAGVITIAGECVAAEVYGFNGVRVASVAGAQSVSVAPGLYIVKTVAADGAVSTVKVAVK